MNEAARRVWLELQFYKDLKGLARKHKRLYASINSRLLPQGLRPDEIDLNIKSAKERLNESKPSFRRRRLRSTDNKVTEIFGIVSTSRTKLKVTIGGAPKVERLERSYPLYHITVGHMWINKVWDLFYSTEVNRVTLMPWLIVSAERVRMNSREVHLYEALCIQRGHKETTQLYVARTVSGGYVGIGYNAKSAFNNAMHVLGLKMDEAIQGEKRDD